MIFKAIEFAAKAHAGQYRKGTRVPYLVHPLNVAKILIDSGCSDVVAVAGILHDTVEDTPITLDEIRKHFGQAVAELVAGASEPDKSDTWENRKKHTIEYLKTASPEVLLVSIADKLDNIRGINEGYAEIGESYWARFNRPRLHQQWYYQSLVRIFKARTDEAPFLSLVNKFEAEVVAVFGNESLSTDKFII